MSKKRNKKSGSKKRRPKTTTEAIAQRAMMNNFGSMRDAIDQMDDDQAAKGIFDEIYQQRVAQFSAVAGRAPKPSDPFTSNELESHWDSLIQVLEQTTSPALVHATRRTERMVTEFNQHLLSKDELEEWYSAIREYERFKKLADSAEQAGEHPMLVLALRRSGMRCPPADEFKIINEGKRKRVSVVGVTPYSLKAAWMKAIEEYCKAHPNDLTAFDALQQQGSKT